MSGLGYICSLIEELNEDKVDGKDFFTQKDIRPLLDYYHEAEKTGRDKLLQANITEANALIELTRLYAQGKTRAYATNLYRGKT
jgi:hypothetical protein